MTMTLPAGGRVAILGGGLQGCATAYYLKAVSYTHLTLPTILLV